MNQHISSDFDDFLREEGIFAEVEAAAIKKVIAYMITEAMAEAHINKSDFNQSGRQFKNSLTVEITKI